MIRCIFQLTEEHRKVQVSAGAAPAAQTAAEVVTSGSPPNNSFKPNPLRYANNMAGRACHVVASATRVGLTQALGAMGAFVTATDKQLHELLTYCIDFASLMLQDAGEFYPFGAVVDRDGVVKAVGGYDGTERPKPQDIYRMLADSFASEASSGSILAAALAANVDIPSDYSPLHPDGMRVHLESSAFSRYIYVPYSVTQRGLFRKHRMVQFAEPIPVQVQPDFFAASAGA